MSHRRIAQQAARRFGRNIFLSMPNQVDLIDPTSEFCNSESETECDEEYSTPRSEPPSRSTIEQGGSEVSSETSTTSLDQIEEADLTPPEDEQLGLDNRAAFGQSLASAEFHFETFMLQHSWLVGYCVRHHATEAMMNDLLERERKRDNQGVHFTSWKGVRAALWRSTNLDTIQLPCCPFQHEALEVRADETIIPCSQPKCESIGRPGYFQSFQYLPLWPQIESMITSRTFGPLMYDYYQIGIHEAACADVNPRIYRDFFSGEVFQKLQRQLGGVDAIENDVFVFLSTDGINAFNSSQYSFWPVILIVANLPPSERFKVANILPVMVIPGSRSPKDLNSFLSPLLHELNQLSTRPTKVKRWDGLDVSVRVHLLFGLFDLMALAKVCLLSGPNGTYPCRFCLISGVWDKDARHMYFPDYIEKVTKTKRGKERKEAIALWDLNNLPLRTPESVHVEYRRIQRLLSRNQKRQAEEIRGRNGFSNLNPSPLLDLPTIFAFKSFPIDIMHLLYENIAPFMVSIWTSTEERFKDIALLSDKWVLEQVDRTLRNSGSGLPTSISRRPRSLRYRNQWKAAEWKCFVLETSTIVLHEWVPTPYLDGWWMFVQLCRLISEWELDEEMVDTLEHLAKEFYQHFSLQYYALDSSRVRLCRYVLHLILHLADNIRSCGPISLLAQWTMETFAGVVKRRCNATNKFAESVAENVKLDVAARMFMRSREIAIPILDDSNTQPVSTRLRAQSEMVESEGFILRHPRSAYSITNLEETRFPGLHNMLARYYSAHYNVDFATAHSLVEEHCTLTLWQRLEDEKDKTSRQVVYRSFSHKNGMEEDNVRSSCYFSGQFEAVDREQVEISYGKALGFLEHEVRGETHILVLASWVTRGLLCGAQGQVFAKQQRSSRNLFSVTTVESVGCMSHPVGVIEAQVPNKSNSLSTRTYFIDELREAHGLLSGNGWRKDTVTARLRGLAKRKRGA